MAIEGGNPLGDDESFDHDECKKVKGSPTPKPKKDYIQARISLRSIMKIISKLSLEQSEAIREIGVGGLLGLRCMKQYHTLTRWLIKNFDPESSLIDVHGQQLLLTPVEVHNVLGIQCEGKDVKLKGSREGFMDLSKMVGVVQGSIHLKGLKDYLKETKSVGDDFKMKFVLYVLGAFLYPTTKPVLKKSYLHAVKNVEAMKECNWAKLTLDFLTSSIRKCKQKGHLRANGCLLLLVVYMKFTHIEKQNQASPENTNFEEQNQESLNDEGFEEHNQPSPKTTCICNDSRIAKVESELPEFKKSFDQYHYDDNRMTKVEKELTEMKMIFIENYCVSDRMAKEETELVGMKSLLTQLVNKVSGKETVSLQPVEVNVVLKKKPDVTISINTDESCLPFQQVEEVNVKSLVKKQPAQGLKRARPSGMTDLNTISTGVDVEIVDPIASQKKPRIKKPTKKLRRCSPRLAESDLFSQNGIGRPQTRPSNELKRSQYLCLPYTPLDIGMKRMKGNKKATIRKVTMDEESELDSDDIKSQKIITLVAVQLTSVQRKRYQDGCHTTWYLPTYISFDHLERLRLLVDLVRDPNNLKWPEISVRIEKYKLRSGKLLLLLLTLKSVSMGKSSEPPPLYFSTLLLLAWTVLLSKVFMWEEGAGVSKTSPSMLMGGVWNAVVVDERDSTMRCDNDHDYQPPCPNDIDATKAMWEVLGVPHDSCSELEITRTDA
ncbi:hypothetical protein RHMOL_Rhmol08G0150700 [Rhododendron molle]|uniref:Uncharacterized protein n=1 Tax=Rhododendron molle TaxID=49168 RepID=A0ACC0MQM4_RHOML|nr:hypothetical protein RHMOL_Rhmol08G0150700 [Rhododendron molle]